ncbi:MAG: chemotaxis protein [Allorhizobium sp.]
MRNTNLAWRMDDAVSEFSDSLEIARSKIETRFLDGGSVLLSVLDAVNKLIGTLDAITGSLDEEAADRTMGELAHTMKQLSLLPQTEASRQDDLSKIADIEKGLRAKVEDMRETLRYLRTFAITAKITGAAIPDFAGFAEEIIDRIRYGTTQSESFAEKLGELSAKLRPATLRGREILDGYQNVVPQIVSDLSLSGGQLAEQHKQLGSAAHKVRALASGVQNKLGMILSAMQIGDISRQRIEHCQSSFTILNEYLESADGLQLSQDQRDRLSQITHQLVFLQLQQMNSDFDRDTGKIVDTVTSFKSDIRAILALRQTVSEGENEGGGSLIRNLEQNVSAAQKIVHTVQDVALEAGQLSQNTHTIVGELLKGIEIVKTVRTDIQYMALNTNLRCSRIGDEGRAINVISAELRAFAGQMDETAEAILTELQALSATAEAMTGRSGSDDGKNGLEASLARALASIQAAANGMDTNLKSLGEQGTSAAELMESAIYKLDFKAELGDILASCAEAVGSQARGGQSDTSGLDAALAEIGGQIGKLYTMVAERELHARVLGQTIVSAPQAVAASDEDLFDDALF